MWRRPASGSARREQQTTATRMAVWRGVSSITGGEGARRTRPMAAALIGIPWQRGFSVTLRRWTSRVRHPAAFNMNTLQSILRCPYVSAVVSTRTSAAKPAQWSCFVDG